jgi:hypothetical protein
MIINQVFHGTNAFFKRFSICDVRDGGFFFTNNQIMASSYTRKPIVMIDDKFSENLWESFKEWFVYEMDEYSGRQSRKVHCLSVMVDYDWQEREAIYKPLKFETEELAWEHFLMNAEEFVSFMFTCSVTMENPLIVNANYSQWDDIEFNERIYNTRGLVSLAQDNGHDGLIIENVFDYGGTSESRLPGDVFVVWNDEQINKTTDFVFETVIKIKEKK